MPPAPTPPAADDDLLDIRAVCRLFGGTRPLNPSTVYKGIKRGVFPAPIPVGGPHTSRWLRSECEAALAQIIDAGRQRRLDTAPRADQEVTPAAEG